MTKCAKCGEIGHFWAECIVKEPIKEVNNVEVIPKPQVERTKAWRKKNPEKYRDYMRRYMREYRARANG